MTRCQAAQERLFTTWQYRATELWARGTSSQIKVLTVGFGFFLIFCTIIMHIAKLSDEYLGYVLEDPWCGNSTAWCVAVTVGCFVVYFLCSTRTGRVTHTVPALSDARMHA